jgi:hypothetical protein
MGTRLLGKETMARSCMGTGSLERNTERMEVGSWPLEAMVRLYRMLDRNSNMIYKKKHNPIRRF